MPHRSATSLHCPVQRSWGWNVHFKLTSFTGCLQRPTDGGDPFHPVIATVERLVHTPNVPGAAAPLTDAADTGADTAVVAVVIVAAVLAAVLAALLLRERSWRAHKKKHEMSMSLTEDDKLHRQSDGFKHSAEAETGV